MSYNPDYLNCVVWGERAREEAGMGMYQRYQETCLASIELRRPPYELTMQDVREWACQRIRSRFEQQEAWLNRLIQDRGNMPEFDLFWDWQATFQ